MMHFRVTILFLEKVSHLKETNPTIKRASDLLQCYSKERGNCELQEGSGDESE
eukprot:jgi/Psemu1/61281/gm1.61281_g